MGADKTFGNRFDDPEGEYRVLYAGSDRLNCFVKCLACFRPDLSLQAALKEISGPDESARLHVQDWVRFRAMGSAEVEGAFADIHASEWVAMLRRKLASRAIALGITEFDLSALQAPRPRHTTGISRGSFSRVKGDLLLFAVWERVRELGPF
jgi:hypothetical protein